MQYGTVNRHALVDLLTAEHGRPDSYSLAEPHRDERLCLEPTSGGWRVFYAERDQRTGERRFASEDEACDFMAARLLVDSGNRRDCP
jgi:hypothetical protein